MCFPLSFSFLLKAEKCALTTEPDEEVSFFKKLHLLLSKHIVNSLNENLILVQDERWQRVLGMQVERVLPQGKTSGKRESNTLVTYPEVWNNLPKGGLIPHVMVPRKRDHERSARIASGGA